MYYNGYEHPKLAAIRLLRSQGCCQKDKKQPSPERTAELESLLRYKEELEIKVAHQRAKLADIPCVIEVGKEIEELQEIIEGLTRENRQRLRAMKNSQKEAFTSAQQNYREEEEEQLEHARLQSEYDILMSKLEKTNKKNAMLVNRLASI